MVQALGACLTGSHEGEPKMGILRQFTVRLLCDHTLHKNESTVDHDLIVDCRFQNVQGSGVEYSGLIGFIGPVRSSKA